MEKARQILVMSDTHGQTSSIDNIVKHHTEITNVFHSGDSELRCHDPLLKGFHIVRGNCDDDHGFPNELIIPIDNHIIYISHGHLHGVKSSLDTLAKCAQQHNASIALIHLLSVHNSTTLALHCMAIHILSKWIILIIFYVSILGASSIPVVA